MNKFLGMCVTMFAVCLFTSPAYAQFGGGLGGVGCGNDFGTKDGIIRVNEFIFNAYKTSMEASRNAYLAVGDKKSAEKISAQLNDAKEANKSGMAKQLKQMNTMGADVNKVMEASKSMVLDENAKKSLSLASEQMFVSGMNLLAASLLSVPVGFQAKQAIDANKICATALLPVVDTVTGLVVTVKAMAETGKSIDDFAKAQGLPPLTSDQKKALASDIKTGVPEIDASLSEALK